MEVLGNPILDSGHEKVMEPSDGDLWARSCAGDRDAFGVLFDRHAKVIYNYCFRRVGNWATAEDVLSFIFLEAWRRRDKELPDVALTQAIRADVDVGGHAREVGYATWIRAAADTIDSARASR
jgi:hypothetical protein